MPEGQRSGSLDHVLVVEGVCSQRIPPSPSWVSSKEVLPLKVKHWSVFSWTGPLGHPFLSRPK